MSGQGENAHRTWVGGWGKGEGETASGWAGRNLVVRCRVVTACRVVVRRAAVHVVSSASAQSLNRVELHQLVHAERRLAAAVPFMPMVFSIVKKQEAATLDVGSQVCCHKGV